MNMNIAVYISLYINATAKRIYHFNWEKKKKGPQRQKGQGSLKVVMWT